MSLTSFIAKPEIRAVFRGMIKRPPFKGDMPMLAPPLTTNYSIVGSAFDYLLRFYVERLNPEARTTGWVAGAGLLLLRGSRPEIFEIASEYFIRARVQYQKYIQDGVLTGDLITGAIRLAYLDVIFRAGADKFDEASFRSPDGRDVADLQALMSIVREQDFKSQKACHLNPTFGSASVLVGGGDADLLIDDKLVDIKTTKNLVLERQHFHQLVGYYVLMLLGGVDVKRSMNVNYLRDVCEVNQLCIYYSRHGYLHSMPLTDLIDPDNLPKFVKWFAEAASEDTEPRRRANRQTPRSLNHSGISVTQSSKQLIRKLKS
jgi:hypothetical protein